jgi:hypothetical protein
MGISDFFKRRRQRESALQPGMDVETGSVGDDVPWAKEMKTVGQPISPTAGMQGVQGMPGMAFDQAQIAAMMQQAFASGNVQVTQGPSQVIDMRGVDGLPEQIVGIMQQHGVDAAHPDNIHEIDTSQVPEMQAQIMQALQQAGLNFPGMAAGGNVPMQPPPGAIEPGGTDATGTGES